MIFQMPLKPHSRAEQQGFTLLEVMVSLAIMALIATVAFAGLSIGVDTWRRGTRKIEEMDGRAAVERLLKRQLAIAYPMQFRPDPDLPAFVLFRGTNSTVEFIADYSVFDGATSFRKIGYRFEGGEFQYEEKNLLDYEPTTDERIEGEPLSKLSDLRFRYLKRLPSDEWSWADEWKVGDGLPRAIQARLNSDVIVIPLVNR
jgi:prepilin-type N-terminal cleavage/methylation domain-containing protein